MARMKSKKRRVSLCGVYLLLVLLFGLSNPVGALADDGVLSDGQYSATETDERLEDVLDLVAQGTESEYGNGRTWTVAGQWSVTVLGATETSERNRYSDKKPAAVYVVDYTYTNLGYERGSSDGLFLSIDDQIVDSAGVMGYSYPGTITNYPKSTPVGATCRAQVCVGVENPGDFRLYVSQYDGNGVKRKATFLVSAGAKTISLNRSELSLKVGEGFKLVASLEGSSLNSGGVTWSSSNGNVVQVDGNGNVTALKAGTATVTCASANGTAKSSSCKVSVTDDVRLVDNVASFESGHPYPNNSSTAWVYTEPGASQLFVTFDERTAVENGYDYLEIYDNNDALVSRNTGATLADKTVNIKGNTVKVKLVSDSSNTRWGFKVTKVSSSAPPSTYSIRYYSNGGTATMITQSVAAGTPHALRANTFTRAGFTFNGWNTVADGSGKSYEDGETVQLTSDLTLYAQWRQAGPTGTGWRDLTDGRKGYAKDSKWVTGWLDLNGGKYWFGDDGAMATGWTDVVQADKTMHYYFNPTSGNLVRGTWFNIEGKTYYFRPSGNLATGWATIDDNGVTKKYYLDKDGQLITGWMDIEQDGKVMHYYFRPSGSMATGWATIDGIKYWFRSSGNMACGFADVDDAYKRYFDETGRMLTGWQQINGNTYYFRSSGAMQTGTTTIDGKSYTFSEKGVLVGGQLALSGAAEGQGDDTGAPEDADASCSEGDEEPAVTGDTDDSEDEHAPSDGEPSSPPTAEGEIERI